MRTDKQTVNPMSVHERMSQSGCGRKNSTQSIRSGSYFVHSEFCNKKLLSFASQEHTSDDEESECELHGVDGDGLPPPEDDLHEKVDIDVDDSYYDNHFDENTGV